MNTAGVIQLLLTFVRENNLVVSTTATLRDHNSEGLPPTKSMINRTIFHQVFPLQNKVIMILTSQNLLPLFATKDFGSLVLCPHLPATNSSAQTLSSKKEETFTIKTIPKVFSRILRTMNLIATTICMLIFTRTGTPLLHQTP